MLKILQAYRSSVIELFNARKIKKKNYENCASKSIEAYKEEIDKFIDWLDDDMIKTFIEIYYFKAKNQAQYESIVKQTIYNSMRKQCERACEKYDKIS